MTPRKTVRQEIRETEQELARSLGELRIALDAIERWRQLAEMRLVNLEHIRDSHDTRLANIERSAERLAQYVDGSMNTTATRYLSAEEMDADKVTVTPSKTPGNVMVGYQAGSGGTTTTPVPHYEELPY